jgi:hypothetical protein
MAVEINQKKGMNKMKFTFMPEHFEWQYSDGSNSGSVNISYTAVPTESSTKTERNRWLMNIGILWVCLAMFARGYQLITGTNLGVTPFGVFGAALALWAYYRTVTFSVFDLGNGSLYVLHDKNHDKILSEIRWRRNEILRDRYLNGIEDVAGSAEEKQDILRWLASEGVISEQERDERMALQRQTESPKFH